MTDNTVRVKKKTLGLLINQLHHRYQGMIFPGILDGVANRDCNLITFVGKPLNSPSSFDNQENLVYQLASPKNIDGILILSGAIGNNLSIEELKAFCYQYWQLPMVCIATPIEGIPSVWVDNKTGMHEIVSHFIKKHNRKRIAFIRGPAKNPEAEIRYSVFKNVLAENGLPLIEDLIYEGNFVWFTGIEGVKTLLDQRKVKFDAILAANDEMLIGVYRELILRGIKIPEEVAIGGFDNIEETKVVMPQITTVSQPLYEEGMKAVNMLVDILEGKNVSPLFTFPSRLITRQSCGCLSGIADYSDADYSEGHDSGQMTIDLAENILDGEIKISILKMIYEDSEIRSETPKAFHDYKDMIRIFLDDFLDELTNRADNPFSRRISGIASGSFGRNSSLPFFYILIRKLYQYAAPRISKDEILESRALKICNAACSILQDTISRYSQNMLIRSRDYNWSMLNVTKTLSTTFDMESLSNVFMSLLPTLDIPLCFIALYGDKIGCFQKPSEKSHIFLYYSGKDGAEAKGQSVYFDTNDLMPDQIWKKMDKSCFVIYPLLTENNNFGYIIFQHNSDRDPIIYETLQGHISASLEAASLIETIKKQSGNLEILLADQKKKSHELEETYKSLKENQERLLIVEKMASLGRMTAGMSHEMKTPLAAIRNCLTELERLKNEYFLSIEDSDITVEDHQNIARDIQKMIVIAQKAAERLSIFIKGIKSQTTDLSPKEYCIFNAVPVIKDAILLLNHKFSSDNCGINLDFPEQEVLLYGFSPRLSQVVTNLLTNAIDACKGKIDGMVTISMNAVLDGADMTVTDNGMGIEKAIQSRIFDPLFSTKSYAEGTGLGLTIVYDIITGEFKGTIEVNSEVGRGTSFVIHFPKLRLVEGKSI